VLSASRLPSIGFHAKGVIPVPLISLSSRFAESSTRDVLHVNSLDIHSPFRPRLPNYNRLRNLAVSGARAYFFSFLFSPFLLFCRSRGLIGRGKPPPPRVARRFSHSFRGNFVARRIRTRRDSRPRDQFDRVGSNSTGLCAKKRGWLFVCRPRFR